MDKQHTYSIVGIAVVGLVIMFFSQVSITGNSITGAVPAPQALTNGQPFLYPEPAGGSATLSCTKFGGFDNEVDGFVEQYVNGDLLQSINDKCHDKSMFGGFEGSYGVEYECTLDGAVVEHIMPCVSGSCDASSNSCLGFD